MNCTQIWDSCGDARNMMRGKCRPCKYVCPGYSQHKKPKYPHGLRHIVDHFPSPCEAVYPVDVCPKLCNIFGVHDTMSEELIENACLPKKKQRREVNTLGSPVGMVHSSFKISTRDNDSINVLPQRFAICLKAFAKIYLIPEQHWTTEVVDEVINEGEQLYNKSKEEKRGTIENMKNISDYESTILHEFTYDEYTFQMDVKDKLLLNPPIENEERTSLEGDQKLDELRSVLIKFFKDIGQYCLLMIDDWYLLIWKTQGAYFVLDVYGRDIDTFISDRMQGVAMMICLRGIGNILHLILNMSNLSPDTTFSVRELRVTKLRTPAGQTITRADTKREIEFHIINENYAFLAANLHLTLNPLEPWRNRSALSTAVAALLATKIDHPATWTAKVLDQFMCFGVNICRCCWPNCLDHQIPIQVEEFPRIYQMGQFVINFWLEPNVYSGIWRCVPNYKQSQLSWALQKAFANKQNLIILQIEHQMYAICQKNFFFYFFDVFRHRIQGNISLNNMDNKTASLRMFRSFDVFLNVLNQVLLETTRSSTFYLHILHIRRIEDIEHVSNIPLTDEELRLDYDIQSLNEFICFDEDEARCYLELREISDYGDDDQEVPPEEPIPKVVPDLIEEMVEEGEGGALPGFDEIETSSSDEEARHRAKKVRVGPSDLKKYGSGDKDRRIVIKDRDYGATGGKDFSGKGDGRKSINRGRKNSLRKSGKGDGTGRGNLGKDLVDDENAATGDESGRQEDIDKQGRTKDKRKPNAKQRTGDTSDTHDPDQTKDTDRSDRPDGTSKKGKKGDKVNKGDKSDKGERGDTTGAATADDQVRTGGPADTKGKGTKSGATDSERTGGKDGAPGGKDGATGGKDGDAKGDSTGAGVTGVVSTKGGTTGTDGAGGKDGAPSSGATSGKGGKGGKTGKGGTGDTGEKDGSGRTGAAPDTGDSSGKTTTAERKGADRAGGNADTTSATDGGAGMKKTTDEKGDKTKKIGIADQDKKGDRSKTAPQESKTPVGPTKTDAGKDVSGKGGTETDINKNKTVTDKYDTKKSETDKSDHRKGSIAKGHKGKDIPSALDSNKEDLGDESGQVKATHKKKDGEKRSSAKKGKSKDHDKAAADPNAADAASIDANLRWSTGQPSICDVPGKSSSVKMKTSKFSLFKKFVDDEPYDSDEACIQVENEVEETEVEVPFDEFGIDLEKYVSGYGDLDGLMEDIDFGCLYDANGNLITDETKKKRKPKKKVKKVKKQIVEPTIRYKFLDPALLHQKDIECFNVDSVCREVLAKEENKEKEKEKKKVEACDIGYESGDIEEKAYWICRSGKYPGFLQKPLDMAVVGSDTGTYESIKKILGAGFKSTNRVLLMTPWNNFVVFKHYYGCKKFYFIYNGCTSDLTRFRHMDLNVGTKGLICASSMKHAIQCISDTRVCKETKKTKTKEQTIQEIVAEYLS